MKRNILVLLILILFFSCHRKMIKPPMQPAFSYKSLGFFMIKNMPPENVSAGQKNNFTNLGIEKIAFRTLAVNPQKILPGTVLFIPATYGRILPSGEVHDGFFLADEINTSQSKNELLLFADLKPTKKAKLFPAAGKRVEVFYVSEPIRASVQQRYKFRKVKKQRKSLADLTATEFDTLLRRQHKSPLSPQQRIQFYSQKGKGIPYEIFLLGEGPLAKYDQDPLMDFARFDCMTFCEHILAATISDSYTSLFKNLQHIRYKNGKIEFLSRNHYTIADWLPNNDWLLHDVTTKVGGEQCKSMTKIIDRRAFFSRNGVAENEL